MNHRGEGYHKELSEANCRRKNFSWKAFLLILKASGFDKLCVVEASRSSVRSLLSHRNKSFCLANVLGFCTWLCLAKTSLACAEIHVVSKSGKIGVSLKKNRQKKQKTSRVSKVFLDTIKNQKKENFLMGIENRTVQKFQNQNNRTPGYHRDIFRLSFLFKVTLGRWKRLFQKENFINFFKIWKSKNLCVFGIYLCE